MNRIPFRVQSTKRYSDMKRSCATMRNITLEVNIDIARSDAFKDVLNSFDKLSTEEQEDMITRHLVNLLYSAGYSASVQTTYVDGVAYD